MDDSATHCLDFICYFCTLCVFYSLEFSVLYLCFFCVSLVYCFIPPGFMCTSSHLPCITLVSPALLPVSSPVYLLPVYLCVVTSCLFTLVPVLFWNIFSLHLVTFTSCVWLPHVFHLCLVFLTCVVQFSVWSLLSCLCLYCFHVLLLFCICPCVSVSPVTFGTISLNILHHILPACLPFGSTRPWYTMTFSA